MEPIFLLLTGLGLMTIMMIVLWIIACRIDDAGIVDVGWAAGLGILAVFYAVYADGALVRRGLVAVLGGLWSFRLATYLLFNRVIGKEEDGRYQRMRAYWGEKANFNFFFFFLAQGFLDIILSLSFVVIAFDARADLDVFAFMGIAIWIISVGGESIADKQLARFRGDPLNKGKTCRRGLWRYSRHPNYFFEWLHWWSYALIAIGAPYAWLAFIAPVLMLVFVLKFTGIPYTEQQAISSRGDDYREYQRTTSAFIPWFPKKGA